MRTALISAISSCSNQRQQSKARRFLSGLSSDELQYIAEFLGACILDTAAYHSASRREVAEGIKRFARARGHATTIPTETLSDQEHKMILLLEFLCACGLANISVVRPAQRAR